MIIYVRSFFRYFFPLVCTHLGDSINWRTWQGPGRPGLPVPKVLGKGFHAKAGEPHAEPTAIADALAQVGGSMLRVLGPIRTRLNFGPPPWSLVDCHWHYGKLSISCQKPFIVDFPFLACLPTATLPSLGIRGRGCPWRSQGSPGSANSIF